MLIDTNAHLGPWPFSHLTEYSAAELVAHLGKHGIAQAVVSHLGAVFQPDPMPANRLLLAATRRQAALVPMPIVNPMLANWREQLDLCCAGTALRAVKILPNYHNYSLTTSRLDPFVAELKKRGVRLVIGVRFEDVRHRYFGLRIKCVPQAAIAKFLQRHADMQVLCLGLSLPEVRELAKTCPNFLTDTAFIEWIKSMEVLSGEFPIERVVFGSQTPFFVTRASVDKLTMAQLSAKARAAYSSVNAQRFFSL
ncbi:MAG: amidohydrolase family protein [Opitutae bacterium]|nr:amidohydrolase family protein [Opitutae bacterium]